LLYRRRPGCPPDGQLKPLTQHFFHSEFPQQEDRSLACELWLQPLARHHSLFDPSLFSTGRFNQLDQVCLRSRSFLLLNWKQNVEIETIFNRLKKVWYIEEPKAQ
jgi:hypothetical protein